MRRWNGWGEEDIDRPLSDGTKDLLEAALGKGPELHDAELVDVLAAVDRRKSRLPDHPLVSKDPEARLRASYGQSCPDWFALRFGEIRRVSDGAAFPETGDDVRALLDWAAEAGAMVIPCGGATSVVGHLTPPEGDRPVLTLSMTRMDRLLDLNETAQLARFQAGVAGPRLEAQLGEKGWTLGHFPQSFDYASLGGWIVTRSSGQQSARYGRIEALFAGGVVETPTGRLMIPALPASAAGPDLREFVLGSEGRIGVLTEAVMRVSRKPEQEIFAGLFFPDWERGEAAARAIAQARLGVSMLRLSNPMETMTTLKLSGQTIKSIPFGCVLLMLGFTGDAAGVDHMRARAAEIAGANGANDVDEKTSLALGETWKAGRFQSVYMRNSLWCSGYAVDTMETAVNWPQTTAMMNAIESAGRAALEKFGEQTLVTTHLSHVYPQGSSVYTTFIFRVGSDYQTSLERWRALKGAVSEAIVANGGTISHQHGVGKDHAPYLEAEKSPQGLRAIADMIAGFDPRGVMDSGNLIGPDDA
ncbi:MAG: FAD-binding oxidoreductase [Parvularculaceae bacterium]